MAIPHARRRATALVLLLTVAAVWLWAHEGHQPLPTSGAEPIKDNAGQLIGYSLTRRARESIDVQTTNVEQAPVEDRLLAHASLVTPWDRHAYATSRLPGRIIRLHVRPGQEVQAGQTLAELESLELEDLHAELLNARNDVELARRVVETMKPLVNGGAAPAQSLIEAETKLQQHQNALEIARGKWLSLGLGEQNLE